MVAVHCCLCGQLSKQVFNWFFAQGCPNLSTCKVPLAYAKTIVPRMAADNDHCTGQGLTSYFECTLFPSSISSHDTVFEPGGVISFPSAPSTYTGTWTQNPTNQTLQFKYYDGGGEVASFVGVAVSNGCFEGRVDFTPPSNYMSMYSVCLTPIP